MSSPSGCGSVGSAAARRSAIVAVIAAGAAADPRRDPGAARAEPSGAIPIRPDHPLVGSGQLEPLAAEGQLVLVQPIHGVAFVRLPPGSGDVRATEIHLGALLADRPTGSPASEGGGVHPGGFGARRSIARVDRRQAFAVAIQDQAGQRLTGRIVARLEIDEKAGGRRPATSRRTPRAARM